MKHWFYPITSKLAWRIDEVELKTKWLIKGFNRFKLTPKQGFTTIKFALSIDDQQHENHYEELHEKSNSNY